MLQIEVVVVLGIATVLVDVVKAVILVVFFAGSNISSRK